MKSKSTISELDGDAQSLALTRTGPAQGRGQRTYHTSFNRRELNAILTAYGYGVSHGLWKDYAIDHLKDVAIFSIFRRASEIPLYRIEKNPKLAKRQGAYAIVTASGHILKRGHELAKVLRILHRKTLKVID